MALAQSPPQPLTIACNDNAGPVTLARFGYGAACYTSGGVGPFQWKISQGQLPEGLTLDPSLFSTPPGAGAIGITGYVKASGLFNYTIQATDSQGQTAAQTFSGTTAPSTCVAGDMSIGPQRVTAESTRSFGLITLRYYYDACPWTLSTDVPGLTINSSYGSTGNGQITIASVGFMIAANPDPIPRQGSIFVMQKGAVVYTIPVLQNSADCRYQIMPQSAQFGPLGGYGSFTVTPSPANCYPFQIFSSGSVVAATADSGAFYYTVPANAGPARAGTVQFASNFQSGAFPTSPFTWTQGAGDGSMIFGCFPPGVTRVGSSLAKCTVAGGIPPYEWSITDGSVPGGFSPPPFTTEAAVLGKGLVPGPYRFTVKVTDRSSPKNITSFTVVGTVLPARPQISCSTSSGPSQVGSFYSALCLPIGGAPPYRWSISDGTLPQGLALSSTSGGAAIISGIPAISGDFKYTLDLTDSSVPAPLPSVQEFSGTISVSEAPAWLSMSCSFVPTPVQVGVPRTPTGCSALGGTSPYSWSVHAGELPAGLAFSSNAGESVTIQGTPTAAVNRYYYTVIKVTDSSPVPQSRVVAIPFYVDPKPSYSCSPAAGEVGKFYLSQCSGFSSGGITTDWVSAGMLPPGLALQYGAIQGTPTTPGYYSFTISAEDITTGAVVTNSYQITVGPLPPGVNTSVISGGMAQLAAGGSWRSTAVLVNPNTSPVQAHLGYFADDGNPLVLSTQVLPGNAAVDAPVLDRIMAPGSVLTVDSLAPSSTPTQTGWTALSSDGTLGGFIRYRFDPWDQEAAVPLEVRQASSYTLTFDNTGGIATGVAIVNLAGDAASIPVTIRDDSGVTLGTTTVSLPAKGHTAFVLSDRFAATANAMGTIRFATPANGRINVVGIRFPPGQRFTTIPVIASNDPGSGSLAHLAVGSGWRSTIELVNTGSTPSDVHVNFFADDGSALPLPLLTNSEQTAKSSVDQTLAAHQRLVLDTVTSGPLLIGSAQLTSSGNVSGFIRFRYDPWNQEAIVPLETATAAVHMLAFDNLNGAVAGVAISNVSDSAAAIPVVIRDIVGNQIGSGRVDLSGKGHTSFVLSDRFPSTLNQVGAIEFGTPGGGQIGVLGIRFTSSGVFSTIPVTTR